MRRAILLCALMVVAGAVPATAADRVVYRGWDGMVVQPVGERESTILTAPDYRAAMWTPDGASIIYTDGAGVWSIPADGSAPPRLLVEDPAAWSLDVSPDGRHVAYGRQEDDGAGILVAPVDGADQAREVTTPGPDATDLDPRWAPDGQAIAFRRLDQRLRRWDLRLADVGFVDPREEASVRVLMDQRDWTTLSAPVWEPDGRHLQVNAVRLGGTGHHDVFRVARAGSAVEVVAQRRGFDHHSPAVSPDGRFVAYARRCADCTANEQQYGEGSGVWLADLVTGMQSLLTGTEGEERQLAWTADASTVVFESFFQDSGCHCDISDLYAVDTPSGVPVQLKTFLPGPLRLAVSPGVALRMSGPSRVETSVAVSRKSFEAAEVVVLARADAYADALAGAPLAGSLSGPVLLTPRDHLPVVVQQEILRLGARRVVLLGDEAAVSPSVEAGLDALVHEGHVEVVERIGGATRYGTAALVADRLPADHGYVVQGAAADPARGWPDAVAVAGLSASEAAPLLLTEHDRLPPETAAAITDGGLTAVTIVGGPAAVSGNVEQQLRQLGVTVDRLDGVNRYATSVAVAHRARERGALTQQVWVATGRNWPDSLSAGPAAAHTGGLLLLVDGLEPNGSGASWDFLEADRVREARLVGGPDVLSPATAVAVARAAP